MSKDKLPNTELQKKKGISYAKYGYYFALPFVVAWLLFMAYPMFYTLYIGFSQLKGIGSTNFKIQNPWYRNFQTILKNQSFRTAFGNTWKMWIINFIPQLSLALLLAAWFSNETNAIKGRGFFKVIFYMPNIITASSIAVLFASLFGYPKGPVNDLLMLVGIIDKPFNFARSKIAAQLLVAFIQFWTWYGYTMIVLISGILGISPDIFEAAEIDGANGVQKFFRITLPNLKTIMLFTLVTSLIGGLQMFDIPSMLMVNAGPDNATLTTSIFIYNQAFKGSYMYNRAAAASMIMFVVISIFSGLFFFMLRDKDEAKLHKMEKERIKEWKRQQKEAKAAANA